MSVTTEHQGDGQSAVPPSDSAGPPTRRRGIRLLLLLGTLAAVTAAGLLTRGSELREAWLERQSVSALRKSADDKDADPLLLFVYARKALQAGDADGALAALVRADEKLPPKSRTRLTQRVSAYLGYLLARSGQGERAVPYLTRARELNDDDPLPHLGFGIVFSSRQMHKFAISHFELAAQLDPDNVEALYRLGKSAIENLKAQQAVAPLTRAVKLAPGDPESRAQLGIAYAVQSQFKEAVPQFRKAVELAPDRQEYRALLANALAMNARSDAEYREAADMLEKARETRPTDDNLLLTEGLLHLRFNNLGPAKESLRACLKIAPTNAAAWYNLSVVEQRQGNNAGYEEARKEFQRLTDVHTTTVNLEKAVASRPKDASLRRKLSQAYKRSGNLAGMYWQLDIASKLSPEDRGIRRELEGLKQNLPPEAVNRSNMASGTSLGPPPPNDLIPGGNSGR